MTAHHSGPELLQQFLDRNGIQRETAGEALGVTRVTIWSWLRGDTSPAAPARQDIETWTSGAVPADSWGPLRDARLGRKEVKPFSEREREDTETDDPPTEDDHDPPSSDSNPKIGASARERTGSNG